MTVPTSTAKSGPYAGSGTTGPFTVSFRFLENSHIQVIKTSSAGVDTTLALGTDYSVAGAGGTSGTVTLVTALAVGEKLTIVRNVPFTQDADYVQNDAFPAESHERALDKLTMQTQQLLEAVDRALQVPITSTQTSDELIEELLDVATTATAAAGSASASATSASASAAAAAASEAAAEGYVGNIINNPILGDDVFNGNGSTTAFTLSRSMTAGTETALLVTISGVTQAPTAAYSVSGTTLTFTSAPPAATGNIRVRYIGAMAVNAALAQTAATNAAASATTASTGATNASNSATAASGSASTASTAATNASSSATAAAGSATTASTAATNASNSATAAAGSASSASSNASSAATSATAASGYLAPVVSTSATSLAIGTGSKSLTIETGKQWVPGMPIKVAVTASPSTNYMTGTVTSYNSGTGALVVDVSAVGGSGTYSAWSLSLQSGSGSVLTTKLLRSRFLSGGTTYTPASDVESFWVFVFGSSNGGWSQSIGAPGGSGYSEKYYPTPSGSYSYAIGAGTYQLSSGTTTFDTISVGGVTYPSTTSGTAGGVASGGDFNANGGTGGSTVSTAYAGAGGPGTRAGAGGNGGTASTIGGGGGGTGGNNASAGTGGAAASAPSGSALVLPWAPVERFAAGGNNSSNNPGQRASGNPVWDTFALVPPSVVASTNTTTPYTLAYSINSGAQFTGTGGNGVIIIVEKLK
jgi:hypothetical protein